MDYEKKYKEVIKRAEAALKVAQNKKEVWDCIVTILPELKENEDEKIRKDIIWCLKHSGIKESNPINPYVNTTVKNAIAWLEKQGEIDKESYKIDEKEKREFVGDGFIKCYADFQDFKEGETYWLEYIGDDKYNVRSDNLLGKTYHITPCQLYTVFKKLTWLEKQGEKPADKVEPKFKVGDTMRTLQEVSNGITSGLPVVVSIDNEYYRCNNETIAIKDQNNYEYPPINKKPTAWSEEDEKLFESALDMIEWYSGKNEDKSRLVSDWLKSLKKRL